MSLPVTAFSDDQAEAFDRIAEVLRSAGVDIEESLTTPRAEAGQGVVAVIGKAGSGKTVLARTIMGLNLGSNVETTGSVHYQGTEALIDRLIANNKDFTMMAYPGRSHSIHEGEGTRRHLFELLTRYLEEHLPSERSQNKPTAKVL